MLPVEVKKNDNFLHCKQNEKIWNIILRILNGIIINFNEVSNEINLLVNTECAQQINTKYNKQANSLTK